MCWERNRYFNINVSETAFEKVVSFPCDSNVPSSRESEEVRGRACTFILMYLAIDILAIIY